MKALSLIATPKMYVRYNCEFNNNTTNTSINSFNHELEQTFGYPLNENTFEYRVIFERKYQSNLLAFEADVLFNKIRKHWVQIEVAVLKDRCLHNFNYNYTTKQIVDTLALCRYSIKLNAQKDLMKNVQLLVKTMIRWSTFNEQLLIKLTSHSVRDDKEPINQYFHMYLDVSWLILCLQYLCDTPLNIYEEIIKDLTVISYTIYKKCDESLEQSPFTCICNKRLWILLQFFCEKSEKIQFWDVFNTAVKNYDTVFVIWLLFNVASLQGYNIDGEFVGPNLERRVCENYALIESTLKSIHAKCNPTKENNSVLLNCCRLIHPLLDEWWTKSVKSDPYQILWEIFNKHINISFETQLSAELMDVVNNISPSTKDSYKYFLHMLKMHLSKHPGQWSRIRGRIYSKLPNNKIKELTNIGLYNIGLLFLSLAPVDITEITEKLLSLLANLTYTDTSLHIHMGLIMIHAAQGLSVAEVSTQLVNFVRQIANDRDQYNRIRAYMDGFDRILKASKSFSLQQHVMISSWVSKYITNCSFSDLCYFLNVLLRNVKLLRDSCAWSEWEPILKQHVLPGLKSIATTSNCPSQVGTLAALIDSNPTSDYVLIFTSDTIAVNVTCHFITELFRNVRYYELPKKYETAILHTWVRCCLLNCEGIEKLTRSVSQVGVLSEVLDFTSLPLCSSLIRLSKVESGLIQHREFCEQCFGGLEGWISPYITTPTSEALTVHIYTCLSVLFFHCSEFLYRIGSPSCLFNRLVRLFLLSSDVLMGKALHPYVLSSIQRTWPLFVQGIFKLNPKCDPYIKRTMHDMLVHYVPLLPIDDSPILKCFVEETLVTFILERLSNVFLAHSSKSKEGNIVKTLKLIQLALENTEYMVLTVKCTLPSIFEVIIFQNNKNLAIDVVKYVAMREQNQEIELCIRNSFTNVTEKHLPFNTNNYFKFTNILVKIIPQIMRYLLPIVKTQIVAVERMRGVGHDNTLRQGLERLEVLLS